MILLIQDKDAWQSGLIILQKVKNNTLAIPLMVVTLLLNTKRTPVLAANSTQFRDPKGVLVEPSQNGLTAAKSQDYKIEIYSSDDLGSPGKGNLHLPMKVLGYQYECPGLIEVPTEQDPSKSHWVMFISINPGAPAGGSFNQYFCWILQWYSF
ncbi:ADM_collapsed_G0005130.mRNA.1.CDS.1 [Saccharomyces cerevisiae]|nr:ADM_collapsed_G0005130.mRNA.1.CDS.1 [Saccharomyces cerevisiae]